MKSYYIITGTSRGIGEQIASDLLNQSDNNYVFGYSRTKSISHKNYIHQNIDFSAPENLEKISLPEIQEADKIVLINNSGTLSDVNPIGSLNNAEIIKGININLTAPIILTNLFIKKYKATKSSEKIIFNISSGAAIYAIDGWSVYCATKAAINMLAEVGAVESKLHGFDFKHYAFAPGKVDTQMQTEIRELNKSSFSNVESFIKEKETGSLNSVEFVSNKVISIINNTQQYQDKRFWMIPEIN